MQWQTKEIPCMPVYSSAGAVNMMEKSFGAPENANAAGFGCGCLIETKCVCVCMCMLWMHCFVYTWNAIKANKRLRWKCSCAQCYSYE